MTRVDAGAPMPSAMVGAKPPRKSLAFLADNTGHHPEEMYIIEKKGAPLGTGAFGTVKLGKNKKTGQQVALKSVHKKGRKQSDMVVLQNEIEINMALDHPNIARMYETFEDNQFIYIAMELCSGGEMFDLIIDQGSFSEVKASILMEQILRAVTYMHAHGIVHRDLKPENFLLTKKGVPVDQNTLKVIDFGISKRFNCSKGEGAPTMMTRAGTAYYIAPEVIAGKGYNEKCDVWSAGVILYILLSGSPPFAGDTDKEIIEAVKRGRISFNGISEFDGVSQEVKTFIQECCTMNPSRRLSAQTAVNHHWIKQPKDLSRSGSQTNSKDSSNLIAKFKAFSSTNRFKKAALHIIAHHVDEDNLRKLREQFNTMDKNGDGELTLEELKAGCREAGIMQSEDINKLFSSIDSDHNGSISYTEFLAATIDQKTYMKRETFWEAFRVFDLDGNGKITVAEFSQIMQNDGAAAEFPKDLAVNREQLTQMFKEADADGDGEIDFNEFVAMMEKS